MTGAGLDVLQATKLAALFWQVRNVALASDPVPDHLVDKMVALQNAAARCVPRAETMSELTALVEVVAADMEVVPAEVLLAVARRGSSFAQQSTRMSAPLP